MQEGLLFGAKLIFDDLAYQGYAFKNSGLCAIEHVAKVDPVAIPFNVLLGWREIYEGVVTNNPALIAAGRKRITDREQNTVVQPAWSYLNSLSVSGLDVGWLFSVLSENPSPGGDSFVTARPGKNIALAADRWAWIDETISANGIPGAWDSLSASQKYNIVQEDLRVRARDFYQPVTPWIWPESRYLSTEGDDTP